MGNDKFVVHSNGHLKRIDASGLSNGSYGFKVTDGTISVSTVETEISPASFKTPNGTTIISDSPFAPVVMNSSGFTKFELPKKENDIYGVVYKGLEGYASQSIKGVNVISQLYGITPQTSGSALYYYNTTLSAWKALAVDEGYSMLYNNAGDVSTVVLSGSTIFENIFDCAKSDNQIVQYNKGRINKINVPATAGNYNLNVDASGNVSFSQGEVAQRQAVTYKLSVVTNNVAALDGNDLKIQGTGTGKFQYSPTFNLKANSKYFVDATFWFKIEDTSVFDEQSSPVSVTLKIGADTTNIIGSQLIYHPESGVLQLHFSGVSALLATAKPDLFLTTDKNWSTMGLNLPILDKTNAGQISFLEV